MEILLIIGLLACIAALPREKRERLTKDNSDKLV